MHKLKSLTIFFPFYNDEGTVKRQIYLAYNIGKSLTDDLEVIAIHGGPSKDRTWSMIREMKKEHRDLKIINKKNNTEGYAVIKYGLTKATKEWVFYTDGDAQYHLEEDLTRLVEKQLQTKADVINGYKIKRHDNLLRVLLGNIYAKLSQIIFKLPIRDVDCDFRLIRKDLLDKIDFECCDSSILPEMIKKLNDLKAKFVELPVSHYSRAYGNSNYNILELVKEKLISDIRLYLNFRKSKKLK